MIKALPLQYTVSHPLALEAMKCEVWRGDVLESVHTLHAALVDEHGDLLAWAGDPYHTTTARSSLKPFQLLPTLHFGGRERFSFTREDIAFMCASHNGEPQHITHCEQLLRKIKAQISDLECGVHAPYHQASAMSLIKSGLDPNASHNNCSGKHCGMIALRHLLNSEDVSSYLRVDHPVQKAIFECVESLLGKKRSWRWGIDGCSLPTPEVSLTELATLFSQLAAGKSIYAPQYDESLELIFNAMSTSPNLVAGIDRFDTFFMQEASGHAVCKVGGEAIRGFALRDNTGRAFGISLKVEDGSMRALHPACLTFLERLNLINRPKDLDRPFSELVGLQRFWRGVELNCAGLEATEIKVKFKERSKTD